MNESNSAPGRGVLSGAAVVGDYLLAPGFNHPRTPALYNRIGMLRWRAPAAAPRLILVLSPGFTAGAGMFRHVGPAIVQATGGQAAVWAIDRRENLMDDRAGFVRGEAAGDPGIPLRYYLEGGGWSPTRQADAPWMADWGLEVALGDLRQVIGRARHEAPGARIILGGHSLGGMLAQAYAASRFSDGAAGQDDLDGLVLIDGMVRGRPHEQRFYDQALAAYARLDAGDRFWEDWIRMVGPLVAIIVELAALAGSLPDWRDEPSLIARAAPGRSGPAAAALAGLVGNQQLTNRALLGLAVDDASSPSAMARAHVGAPGPVPGNPALAGWREFWEVGEIANLDTYALLLRDDGAVDGLSWHSPIRLNADLDSVQNLDSRLAPAALKSRAPAFVTENAGVHLPVLAFANLDHPNTTLDSYDWYQSAIRSAKFTRVEAPGYAHMDPLVAPAESNLFLKALVPWLEQF